MGQSGMATTKDGSAGRGGISGRRARRSRLRHASVQAHRTADDRRPLLDPWRADGRRRTSCSSRSIPQRFRNSVNMTCTREFPFPRAYEARVIDHLREAGAKVIAMDIQFTQPTDPTDDQDLAAAIERAHGKVVLAATEVPQTAKPRCSAEIRYSTNWEPGRRARSITLDTDGEIRRFGYAKNGLKSFPVVTAEVATGHRVPSSLFSHGPLPIDFAGPPETLHQESFFNVLTGKPDPSLFRQQDRHRRRVSADPSRRSRHGHDQRRHDVGAGSVGQRGLDAACGERRCETCRAGSTCS